MAPRASAHLPITRLKRVGSGQDGSAQSRPSSWKTRVQKSVSQEMTTCDLEGSGASTAASCGSSSPLATSSAMYAGPSSPRPWRKSKSMASRPYRKTSALAAC
eukprot:scaffold4783_cov69-Phaeocystis_antarctica.AAC.2